MNKRFIEYLKQRISIIKEKIAQLEAESETLSEKGIDLNEYGGRYEARRIFNAYHGERVSTVGRVFNVTTKRDLEEFIKTREMQKLQKEISRLNRDVISLSRATEYYQNGVFTGYINPNDELIRCIYDAGIEGIVTNEEMVELIVSLSQKLSIRNPRSNEVVMTEIGIANCFDERFMIREGVNSDRVGNLFSKLLLAVQRGDARRAQFKKNAELTDYIKESQATKKTTINVPTIGKDGKFADDVKTTRVVNDHLDEASIKLILRGNELLEEIKDEEVKKILLRCIRNVISQCIYLDLLHENQNIQANKDILSERVAILKELVEALSQKQDIPQPFLYQKNEDGLPKILEDIHMTDPLGYGRIYKILVSLANGDVESKRDGRNIDVKKLKCELVKRVAGVDFYAVSYKNYSVIFSYVNERILIHRLINSATPRVAERIGPEEINSAKAYQTRPISETAEVLSEAIVIETLDLKDQVQVNSFRKSR